MSAIAKWIGIIYFSRAKAAEYEVGDSRRLLDVATNSPHGNKAR